jgi:hypothetical protein
MLLKLAIFISPNIHQMTTKQSKTQKLKIFEDFAEVVPYMATDLHTTHVIINWSA